MNTQKIEIKIFQPIHLVQEEVNIENQLREIKVPITTTNLQEKGELKAEYKIALEKIFITLKQRKDSPFLLAETLMKWARLGYLKSCNWAEGNIEKARD